VVLEAGERAAGPGAVEEHVPDHPPLARDGVEREQTDSGQLGSRDVDVGAAEQLVAAAHGEERRAARDGLVQRIGLGDEVVRHELLLPILAAADVEEVDAVRHGVVHADRRHLELVAARARPRREHGDVAAVGVDVQVVGVEVADADPHPSVSQ
jgi:hypothetical protein